MQMSSLRFMQYEKGQEETKSKNNMKEDIQRFSPQGWRHFHAVTLIVFGEGTARVATVTQAKQEKYIVDNAVIKCTG